MTRDISLEDISVEMSNNCNNNNNFNNNNFNNNNNNKNCHVKELESLDGLPKNIIDDQITNCNNNENNKNYFDKSQKGRDCVEDPKKMNPTNYHYDLELKKLKTNYFIFVFIFYVLVSIFFGGMMLGLPWFKTSFYDPKGNEVCEKDIHLGDQKPPLQKTDQVYWEEYQKGYKVLTVSLVSNILLFLDVLMVIPVVLFKSYYSMIPEIIYYCLDWSLMIVILSTYKSYYLIPLSFAVTGCSSRSSFENFLGPAVFFAISRLAALKLIRIIVSFYYIYKSNFLLKKKQPHRLYESTGPLNFTATSCQDLSHLGE
ncbi:hypothetical protein ACTA71_004209 [Dictyostelium dimigraforme]